MPVPEQIANKERVRFPPSGVAAYAGALACVVLLTGVIHLVPGAEHLANISMVYLLGVIVSGVFLGSGPAVFASVLSFLAFDWFFVEPRHTFTVHDPGEWIALVTFLVTAITTGQLTAMLRKRAEEARQRERETAALAEASWAVASQVETERALHEVLRRVAQVVPARGLALLVEEGQSVSTVARWGAIAAAPSCEVVRFVRENRRAMLWSAPPALREMPLAHLGQPGAAYLPLAVESGVLGVLYAELPADTPLTPQQRRVVESLANHAAVVLERDRLARAHAHTQALEEADRLKTALLSMVSHDFRSPLAGIKAGVTSLLPGRGGEERELLEGIDQETDRLNRMVGNILALSRLEAGAWRPQKEPLSPEELIGTALGTFGPDDNGRIDVRIDAGAALNIDPVQMTQVVRNLVDNALKYSPPGSPLELELTRPGAEAVLSVADRGPGLPPGEEERVFEPFHRAAEQRESAVPGVGLGLAVCRGLVQAHGGQLSARNREGGGAVFEIRLPLG